MAEARANFFRLRVEIDQRNTAQNIRTLQMYEQEMEDMRREMELGTRLADAYEDAINRQTRAVQQQSNVLRAAPKPASGGGGTSRLETLDRLGSVGSQIAGGLGAGGIGNAAGLLGDVAGSITSLGAIGAVTTVALAGVTAALNVYNQALEKSKERAQAYSTALTQAFEATSKAQIEQLIQQQESRIEGLQATAEVLERRVSESRDQLNITLESVSDGLADALNNLAGTPTEAVRESEVSVQAWQDELTKTNQQIELAQVSLDAYRLVIEDATLATEDAAAAQERLNGFIQGLKDAANELVAQGDRRLEIDRLTAEQRQTRGLEIARQIELLTADRNALLTNGSEVAGQAAYQLGQRIGTLENELILLTDTTQTYADTVAATAAAQKAVSQQTDNYFAALENTVQAQEAVFAAQQKSQEVYEQYIADGLKLSTEAQERLNEIDAESGEQRVKIVEDSNKQIAKLERDYKRSQFNAVAERDALAAQLAKIRAEDELTDTKDAEADRLKEQEKSYDKQFRALQNDITKRAAALDTSYRQQQQIAAYAQSRALVDLTNAKYAEIALTQSSSATQRTIHQDMWGQLNQIAVTWASNTVGSVRGIMGAFTGSYATQYPMSVGSSTPVTTQQVFGAVDTRLNQYFNAARVITRD